MTGNRVFCDLPNSFGLENIWVLLWNRRTPQPKANPTQEKNGINVEFGPLFPTANDFLWVGIDYIGNRLQETQPNQTLRKHPNIKPVWCLIWLSNDYYIIGQSTPSPWWLVHQAPRYTHTPLPLMLAGASVTPIAPTAEEISRKLLRTKRCTTRR